MGTIKIDLLSDNQNALKHPVFQKGAMAQHIQIKYGTSKMEQIETPDGDFHIAIDVDKFDQNDFDWYNVEYPNEIVKQQVLEIIYFTNIKNRIEEIFEQIRYMDYDKRYDLKRVTEPLIHIIENLVDSKYLESFDLITKHTLVDELTYTIQQKEGKYLLEDKPKSNRAKDQLVSDYKKHLESDLSYLRMVLREMKIKKDS